MDEQVADPHGEAVDDDQRVAGAGRDRGGQIERCLDRGPRRSLVAVRVDARAHVVVERLGGRDEHHGAIVAAADLDGERALAAARTADEERQSRPSQ